MDERYGTLRTLAVVFKILAWVALFVFGLLAIWALIVGTPGNKEVLQRVYQFLYYVVKGALSFLFALALGECIQVFLAIEENTRSASERLEQTQGRG